MMISSLTTKIGLGTLSIATIAISGWTIYSSVTPNTFGDMLSKENLSLLKDNAQEWEKLIQKHKEIKQQNLADSSTIQGLDLNGNADKESLKKKCHELWNKQLNEVPEEQNRNRIKKEIKDWCVNNPKAITISQDNHQ